MADSPSRLPPVRVTRVIERVRAGLVRLTQSLVPGNIALLDLATGAWTTQMLYVAAKLGIADQLARGPRHANDVARTVGSDPDATHRLMRAMASKGALRHRRDGKFELTRIGDALRSDVPGALRDMVLFGGHPVRWEDWGNLLHSVQTGQTAIRMLRGMDFFDYLNTNAELATAFNNAMTAMSALTNDAVVTAYDFSGSRLVVDVGGGHGSFLVSILNRAPAAKGILYDLAPVVEGAGPALEAAGVAGRCVLEHGSFFDSVPDGADAYIMRGVIHDWDDENALRILRNIRTAIAADGKLLLVEMVLPERATAHFGMMLDLEMLLAVGGRERTRAEYANLLSRAGFRVSRVVGTVTPMSIIEATPA